VGQALIAFVFLLGTTSAQESGSSVNGSNVATPAQNAAPATQSPAPTVTKRAESTQPETAPADSAVTVADPHAPNNSTSEPTGAPAVKPVAAAPLRNGMVALPPEKAQPVRAVRFETPPVIDGKLDDVVWQSAVVLKDFYQVNPGDNIAPSKPTLMMIGYDAKFLYFAFHCFDDPSKVRASVAKRDYIFNEDNVRVYLDTFNDQRRAYVLGWNPFGVQQDGLYTEGGGNDFSTDIVMESKGIITTDGWTLEVAIPFKSLRYEAGKGKSWGMLVWRNIDRFNDEIDSWTPVSRSNSSQLGQAAHLTGLENLSTERTLELIPSLTLSETGKRVRSIPPFVLGGTPGLIDEGRFVNEPITLDPGLTAKLGITPTVTLDLALNPDFAQVEADQLVVTTNQRFPIFYPERRPFFLEGIDIFQTQLTPVHTRAIVDPDIAVKLSGKLQRNSFGLMLASDNAPGNFTGDDRLAPGNQRFLDKNSYIGVLRLKHDVGKENSVGMIATTSNFIEDHNHVGGFDARFRLNDKTTYDFQVLGSTSRGFFYQPDQDSNIYRTGNGFAYSTTYDVTGRNWGWTLWGEGRTHDYKANVGFTPRQNTNFNAAAFRYSTDPNPKAALVSWKLTSFNHIDYDFQGRLQIWESDAVLTWYLQRSTIMYVAYRRGHERLIEEEFGPKRTATQAGAFFGSSERAADRQHFVYFVQSQPSKKFFLNLKAALRVGTFDFDFGGGRKFPRVSPAALIDPNAPLDPGPGNLLDITGEVAYQPTNEMRLTLDYTKNRLERQDTRLVAFDDNIYSLRGTYQFSRFLAVRARLDYSTIDARARAQLLFGYTPSPGTAFYAGYNDDVNRNAFSPINGLLEPGLRRNGRTFFIKMSYLFRRSL
jgi:hypothetical protein